MADSFPRCHSMKANIYGAEWSEMLTLMIPGCGPKQWWRLKTIKATETSMQECPNTSLSPPSPPLPSPVLQPYPSWLMCFFRSSLGTITSSRFSDLCCRGFVLPTFSVQSHQGVTLRSHSRMTLRMVSGAPSIVIWNVNRRLSVEYCFVIFFFLIILGNKHT